MSDAVFDLILIAVFMIPGTLAWLAVDYADRHHKD